MKNLILAIFLGLGAQMALCADSSVTGTISELDTATGLGGAPGNGDLRVFINGVSSFCPLNGGDATWAFINANDANYKAAVATLSMAYATGKQTTIYTRPGVITGAGTYCQISWIQVHG